MVPIPGVVYKHHTNTMVPWYGKPIPYPTHTNKPKMRAYGMVLTNAWLFLQHGSQLAGGKPPGPLGMHV